MIRKLLHTYSPRTTWFIVVYALHLGMLFLLYRTFGINTLHEGDKYLSTAAALDLNHLSSLMQWQWSYSSYIGFLALCLRLHLNAGAILLIQYLIGLYGYYCFYQCIRRFSPDNSGFLGILLIFLSPLLAYWQLTFYSESLYTALALIFTNQLFRPKKRWSALTVSGILLLFCRPQGIFFLLAGMVVLLRNSSWAQYRYWLLAACSTFLLLVIFFAWPLHPKGIAEPVAQGSVICGFPLFPDIILNGTSYTLIEAYQQLIAHSSPGLVFELFFKKLGSFFCLTRPYYSNFHNLVNAFHYIFYSGPLLLLFRKKQAPALTSFLTYTWLVLIGHALLTGLFFNEWHERYIVPLFPFFIVLSVFSFYRKPSHAV